MKTLAASAPAVVSVQTIVHNDARCLISSHSMSAEELARLGNAHLEDLFKYNEYLKSHDQVVTAGVKVYVQPKRLGYRGGESWHHVREGETMMDISTHYGVDYNRLHTRNRMLPGEEPLPGNRIKIRGKNVEQGPMVQNSKLEPEDSALPIDPTRMDIEIAANGPQNQSRPSQRDQEEEYMLEEPVTVSPGPSRSASGNDSFSNPPSRPTLNTSTAQYHVVKAGETLWRISKTYQMTVEMLKELNQLNSNTIQTGMKLRVK